MSEVSVRPDAGNDEIGAYLLAEGADEDVAAEIAGVVRQVAGDITQSGMELNRKKSQTSASSD